jgi:hypothetical protein
MTLRLLAACRTNWCQVPGGDSLRHVSICCRYFSTSLQTRKSLGLIQPARPTIYSTLDPLRNNWLAGDLQQTSTWSKLSPPGYWLLTPISSVPGYKPWRHVGQMLKCQWWLWGCHTCTVCCPYVMYIHVYTNSYQHQLVCCLIFETPLYRHQYTAHSSASRPFWYGMFRTKPH